MKKIIYLCCLSLAVSSTQAQFASPQLVNQSSAAFEFIDIDFDNDGDRDIMYSSPGPGVQLRENDGTDTLGANFLVAGLDGLGLAFDALRTADVDSDGDEDLIAGINDVASYYYGFGVAWFENTGGSFVLREEMRIGSIGYNLVESADMDSDGDPDIVFADAGGVRTEIRWIENLGGYFGTGIGVDPSISVADSFSAMHDLKLTDLDGDGLTDIVASVYGAVNISIDLYHFELFWIRNLGGGVFAAPQYLENDDFTFTVSGYPSFEIAPADFDGDGDLDIATASPVDNKLWVYSNIGSAAGFVSSEISVSTGNRLFVKSADIDGDGDPDLLASNVDTDEFYYLENMGSFLFANRQLINEIAAEQALTLDYNNDGSDDLITEVALDVSLHINLSTGPCITTSPPQNLSDKIFPDYVALNWDPIPDATSCRIKMIQIDPAGPEFDTTITPALSSLLLPIGMFDMGSTWEWKIKSNCGPSDSTGFSVVDTFTVPGFLGGISATDLLQFELFPNPADNFVLLQVGNGNYQLSVYDVQGQLQFELQFKHTVRINTAFLASGLYLLRIRNENGGKVGHQRLMIR